MIIKNYCKSEEGVAAAEFALLAPVLLFMLFGMIDYGMYINTVLRVENTALATAQYIAQGGDEADITADIMLQGSLGLTADNVEDVTVDVDYVYECDDAIPVGAGTDCGDDDYLRQYVEVDLTMDYEPMVPYPGLGDTITLVRSVRLQTQ